MNQKYEFDMKCNDIWVCESSINIDIGILSLKISVKDLLRVVDTSKGCSSEQTCPEGFNFELTNSHNVDGRSAKVTSKKQQAQTCSNLWDIHPTKKNICKYIKYILRRKLNIDT